jgi:hypothetical protein
MRHNIVLPLCLDLSFVLIFSCPIRLIITGVVSASQKRRTQTDIRKFLLIEQKFSLSVFLFFFIQRRYQHRRYAASMIGQLMYMGQLMEREMAGETGKTWPSAILPINPTRRDLGSNTRLQWWEGGY